MDLQELTRLVTRPRNGRIIVGISGPPGGGKTTLARALCHSTGFAHAPGDGFIIAESYTDSDGEFHERGAVSGFDTASYADLMRALKTAHLVADVTVPNYRHTQDGAGADEWIVPKTADGVVTECNFLGSASHGWRDVRNHLDILVYLDQTWDVCRPRLMERQLAKGRSQDEAAARVDSHDHQNYLEATRAAAIADAVISASSLTP